jgi:hypothetical protein
MLKKQMKNLAILCFCIYAGVFSFFIAAPSCATAADAVAAQAVAAENEAILRELMALREEVAALREEMRILADHVMGKGETASDSPSGSPSDLPSNLPSNEDQRVRYITEELRMMKSASLLYYADHLGAKDMEAGFVAASLEAYLSTGKVMEGGQTRIHGKVWLVGCDVSKDSEHVRRLLRDRARSLGLVDERGEDYSGGDAVFMVAR